MTLKAHSDGSHLSVSNARNKAAGYFYFGDKNDGTLDLIDPNQGPACQGYSVIKPVMASAAECETATLFINFQTAIVIRTTAKSISKIKSKFWDKNHKHGIRVPRSVKEATLLDA